MDTEQINRLALLLDLPPDQVEAAVDSIDEEDHFYYNPNAFSKLHRVDCEGIRRLVVPNLRRLRR